MYPVTTAGRFSAVLLMIGGIIIVGVVSGTVVSYLSDRIRHVPDPTNEDD
jgi:voltage-gated potassium channel